MEGRVRRTTRIVPSPKRIDHRQHAHARIVRIVRRVPSGAASSATTGSELRGLRPATTPTFRNWGLATCGSLQCFGGLATSPALDLCSWGSLDAAARQILPTCAGPHITAAHWLCHVPNHCADDYRWHLYTRLQGVGDKRHERRGSADPSRPGSQPLRLGFRGRPQTCPRKLCVDASPGRLRSLAASVVRR